jgi:hypothetical protein
MIRGNFTTTIGNGFKVKIVYSTFKCGSIWERDVFSAETGESLMDLIAFSPLHEEVEAKIEGHIEQWIESQERNYHGEE